MPDEKEHEWQQTNLSRASRALRLFGAVLYLGFVSTLILLAGPELTGSPLGAVVFGTLVLAAAHDFYFIFRRGARWNDTSIQNTGTLLHHREQNWDDLISILPNMHKRATVLTFKRHGSIRLYWGFEHHREILDYAKERLEHARTS